MIDEHTTAQARAHRLLFLRNLSGLSRDKLQSRYRIARGTLQNWESARCALTTKGAKLVIRAYQAEGIYCSFDWLMFGIGPSPKYEHNRDSVKSGYKISSDIRIPTPELLYFRKNNTNSIDTIVYDDSLSPLHSPGDYVAGIRVSGEQILHVCEKICIIQTLSGEMIVRYLRRGDELGLYHLIVMNTQARQKSLYNQEIIAAARIIWVYTKEMVVADIAVPTEVAVHP